MGNMSDKSQARKDLLDEFSRAKRDLKRVSEENEALKVQNEKLQDELVDKDEAVQNLFSYIHTKKE
jgi:regulator of replication initiation timing